MKRIILDSYNVEHLKGTPKELRSYKYSKHTTHKIPKELIPTLKQTVDELKQSRTKLKMLFNKIKSKGNHVSVVQTMLMSLDSDIKNLELTAASIQSGINVAEFDLELEAKGVEG